MTNLSMICSNMGDLYSRLLFGLLNYPEYSSSPRGKKIHEYINYSFMLKDPRAVLYKSDVRSTPEKYLSGEFRWYFSGSNKVEDILPYSSFWKHIQNSDGTANSAYGYLIFKKLNKAGKNQWQWAYDSLVKDIDTRQAIMYFGGPDYQFETNKDFVCTNQAQFIVRDNKLHMIVSMRSNDIIKGTTFDVPFFSALQQNMLVLLQEVYPELTLGYYYHNAASMHLYETDFELAKEMTEVDIQSEDLIVDRPVVDKDGNWVNQDETIRDLINLY